MSLVRAALLAASRSPVLAQRATRWRFVKRAVKRFMPGERLDDALGAAESLRQEGLPSILTSLGENVVDAAAAAAVASHYIEALDRCSGRSLDAEVSVKLTHLGLDLDPSMASAHVARIAGHAERLGRRVWIDMEDSTYTDATLSLYRELRPRHPLLGVALQSYLRRTPGDLERLLPLGPAVRLVKGAYREPPDAAFPRKQDVDEGFFRLALRLLGPEGREAGAWAVLGTHDEALIRRILAAAGAEGAPPAGFEIAMLYGIRRDLQRSLARGGRRVRVLISYGPSWFPWYMRRLAERPANLWFVARSVMRR
ncbi:MAG TPA: proline dehydrogenase family protein [Candidatus Polarisedimenticolia bacterium]|nr:proline dehydrogenase family protein [Candidatus Polarisedimenticolia bacterium]